MADISISVRRGSALALCVVFFLLVVLVPTAKAVFTEIVVGGVVASGAGAAIALGVTVLLLTMTVSNLKDAADAAADAAGTDTKTWLKTKIQEYAIDTGTTIQSVIQGLGFTKDGKITLSQALGDWAAQVMRWLIGNNDITPPTTSSYGTVSTIYGDIYVLGSGTYFLYEDPWGTGMAQFYLELVNAEDVYSYVTKTNGIPNQVNLVSDTTFSVNTHYYKPNGRVDHGSWTVNSNQDGIYYYTISQGLVAQNNQFLPVLDGISGLPTAGQWEDWTGSYTGVEEGYDVGIWEDEDADAGYVLDPTGVLGLDSSIPLDPAIEGSMVDINDYLDVLSDALAGDDPVALDLVGGEVLPLPGIASSPSIPVTVPDTALDDSYPATGENTPDDVPYTGTGEYSLNLTNFFPFCIPFDIYRMLRLFDSQAEAPEITIPIVVDSLGISEEVSIDLSVFDSVAQILRTVELIAFCVGLAFVTKKLIQGG